MDSSGKKLESLVQRIEAHLAPDGFTVDLRRREYLPSGAQYAEYDIYITGPVGSTTVKWLIECRDRPQSGPAPGEWIRELGGTKIADQFDKVFAVSTTGFTEPAEMYARTLGIVLRTVTDITDVADDFETIKVSSYQYGFRPAGPIQYEGRIPPPPRFEPPWNYQTIRMRVVGEPKYQSFADFIYNHFDRRQVAFKGEEPVSFVLTIRGQVEVLVGRQHMRLLTPRIPVEGHTVDYPATILTARRYAEGERVIALDGEFVSQTPKGPVTYRLQVMDKSGGERETVWERVDGPPDHPMPRTIITERFR